MMRVPIIVANWKMHKTLEEGVELVSELIKFLENKPEKEIEVVLCPSFIHLFAVSRLLTKASLDQLYLGAQNCHYEHAGAFTGEISAAMLRSVGTRYVIIGHSERRQYFGEDGTVLAAKVNQVLMHAMRPIFCCGEDQVAREEGSHTNLVAQQIAFGLGALTSEQVAQIIIAYEPIWAIGSGRTPSLLEIETMCQAIRQNLAERYNSNIAAKIPILYGGSCNAQNAAVLLSSPTIDGLLVGGASLEFNSFWPIIQAAF
jgi:triosephosphate isomerase